MLLIVAAARARNLSVAEPQTFFYQPGRGVRVTSDGETIIVGNTAFLHDAAVAVPAGATDSMATDVSVVRANTFGTIRVADIVRPKAAGCYLLETSVPSPSGSARVSV